MADWKTTRAGVVGAVGKISESPQRLNNLRWISVQDSHPLSTTETGDKCRLHETLFGP